MMSRHVWLVGIAVCLTGAALAQEVTPAKPATPAAAAPPLPATPAAPPANSTTTKADAAQPPAPVTPASAASAEKSPVEGDLDAEKIMAAQKAGYQLKNENGQTLLCRRDLQTGSRVRYTTSCMTVREWEQLHEDNELMLKSMERRPRMGNK